MHEKRNEQKNWPSQWQQCIGIKRKSKVTFWNEHKIVTSMIWRDRTKDETLRMLNNWKCCLLFCVERLIVSHSKHSNGLIKEVTAHKWTVINLTTKTTTTKHTLRFWRVRWNVGLRVISTHKRTHTHSIRIAFDVHSISMCSCDWLWFVFNMFYLLCFCMYADCFFLLCCAEFGVLCCSPSSSLWMLFAWLNFSVVKLVWLRLKRYLRTTKITNSINKHSLAWKVFVRKMAV